MLLWVQILAPLRHLFWSDRPELIQSFIFRLWFSGRVYRPPWDVAGRRRRRPGLGRLHLFPVSLHAPHCVSQPHHAVQRDLPQPIHPLWRSHRFPPPHGHDRRHPVRLAQLSSVRNAGRTTCDDCSLPFLLWLQLFTLWAMWSTSTSSPSATSASCLVSSPKCFLTMGNFFIRWSLFPDIWEILNDLEMVCFYFRAELPMKWSWWFFETVPGILGNRL